MLSAKEAKNKTIIKTECSEILKRLEEEINSQIDKGCYTASVNLLYGGIDHMLEYIKYVYNWCADRQVEVTVQTHFRSGSLIIYMRSPFSHHQTMKIVKVSDIEKFSGNIIQELDNILNEMFREIRDKEKIVKLSKIL